MLFYDERFFSWKRSWSFKNESDRDRLHEILKFDCDYVWKGSIQRFLLSLSIYIKNRTYSFWDFTQCNCSYTTVTQVCIAECHGLYLDERQMTESSSSFKINFESIQHERKSCTSFECWYLTGWLPWLQLECIRISKSIDIGVKWWFTFPRLQRFYVIFNLIWVKIAKFGPLKKVVWMK